MSNKIEIKAYDSVNEYLTALNRIDEALAKKQNFRLVKDGIRLYLEIGSISGFLASAASNSKSQIKAIKNISNLIKQNQKNENYKIKNIIDKIYNNIRSKFLNSNNDKNSISPLVDYGAISTHLRTEIGQANTSILKSYQSTFASSDSDEMKSEHSTNQAEQQQETVFFKDTNVKIYLFADLFKQIKTRSFFELFSEHEIRDFFAGKFQFRGSAPIAYNAITLQNYIDYFEKGGLPKEQMTVNSLLNLYELAHYVDDQNLMDLVFQALILYSEKHPDVILPIVNKLSIDGFAEIIFRFGRALNLSNPNLKEWLKNSKQDHPFIEWLQFCSDTEALQVKADPIDAKYKVKNFDWVNFPYMPPEAGLILLRGVKNKKKTHDPEAGIKILTIASRKGDPGAHRILSECYFRGLGVQKNTKSALYHLKMSNPPIDKLLHAARESWLGLYGQRDEKTALKIYKYAAEKGNANAQIWLAQNYYNTGKFEKAFYYFSQAATQNHPLGQYYLGLSLQEGHGCNKNPVLALENYQRSAEQHCDLALFKLGKLYEKNDKKTAFMFYVRSIGIGHDYLEKYGKQLFDTPLLEEAIKELTSNAMKGRMEAAVALGWLYFRGIIVNTNLDKMRNYFSRRPAADHPLKLEGLAHFYELIDDRQAFELYDKAAEQNLTSAKQKLGHCYLHGEGCESNYQIALDLLCQAMEEGNVAALNDIGYAYEQGLSLPQSYENAIHYYTLAAAKGNARAKDRLETLKLIGIVTIDTSVS